MADNIKDNIVYPETITVAVQSISKGVRNVYVEEPITDCVIKFEAFVDAYKFVQTEDLTEAGIAVHPYGAIIVPDIATAEKAELEIEYAGVIYSISNVDFNTLEVGDTFEVSENGEVMPDKQGGTKLYGPYYANGSRSTTITSGNASPITLGGIDEDDHYVLSDSEGNTVITNYVLGESEEPVKFLLCGYYISPLAGDFNVIDITAPTYFDNEGETQISDAQITIYNPTESSITFAAEDVMMWFYADKELEVVPETP